MNLDKAQQEWCVSTPQYLGSRMGDLQAGTWNHLQVWLRGRVCFRGSSLSGCDKLDFLHMSFSSALFECPQDLAVGYPQANDSKTEQGRSSGGLHDPAWEVTQSLRPHSGHWKQASQFGRHSRGQKLDSTCQRICRHILKQLWSFLRPPNRFVFPAATPYCQTPCHRIHFLQ